MKIPLFDIDWTLLDGGNKAHGDSFDYAFKNIFGLPNVSKNEIKTDGMIDTQILIEVLKLHNYSEAKSKEKMDEAISVMEEYYKNHVEEGKCIALKGVKETLEILKEKSILCGLLTGNVESIGWSKVERAGIKDYFSFGAFGDCAYRRVDLIAVAQKRAELVMKRKIERNNFVIIGDSPLDVACAKAGGLQVIAVAQGNFSETDLQEAGADLVLPTLEDANIIVRFLEA